MLKQAGLAVLTGIALSACVPTSPQTLQDTSRQAAIAEVSARTVRFADYPKPGATYLSFSQAHGFQVNYLAPGGRAWLWYPGNARGVPEEYKRARVGGSEALCWRHPSNSYNPVTRQSGGGFACSPLDFARKTIVAALDGDPFDLASGAVPYRLNRCHAPEAFRFDRTRFGC